MLICWTIQGSLWNYFGILEHKIWVHHKCRVIKRWLYLSLLPGTVRCLRPSSGLRCPVPHPASVYSWCSSLQPEGVSLGLACPRCQLQGSLHLSRFRPLQVSRTCLPAYSSFLTFARWLSNVQQSPSQRIIITRYCALIHIPEDWDLWSTSGDTSWAASSVQARSCGTKCWLNSSGGSVHGSRPEPKTRSPCLAHSFFASHLNWWFLDVAHVWCCLSRLLSHHDHLGVDGAEGVNNDLRKRRRVNSGTLHKEGLTFPLTLWIGSTTTATALWFKASKLCAERNLLSLGQQHSTSKQQHPAHRQLMPTCWVLMSTPESQQPKPGWEWYLTWHTSLYLCWIMSHCYTYHPTTISGLPVCLSMSSIFIWMTGSTASTLT